MKRLCIGLVFYGAAVTYLWLTVPTEDPREAQSRALDYAFLKDRDDFHWWAIGNGYDVSTGSVGAYLDRETRAAWEAWRSRAKAERKNRP